MKVKKNPLSRDKEGYGKPSRNKDNINLSGFFKVKIRQGGICIVYQVARQGRGMKAIIIGMRKKQWNR